MQGESPLSSHLQFMLVEEDGGGRVMVDAEPYLEFDLAMNRDLEILEDRWAHLAAPGVGRKFRRGMLP